MNTNLRALIFGAAVAAALTIAMNAVYASEPLEVIRLDTIEVTAHRDARVEVIRLDPIVVTAHKDVL